MFFYFNATRMGCNSQNELYFNLTQPVWIATAFSSLLMAVVSFQSNATRVDCNKERLCLNTHTAHFNLTQPVWIATANLHKRSNKLSCILYSVCLFFDYTIWSDTDYCNGIISFLYNIWCEATSKTMFTYHSHLWQTKTPSSHNEMAVCRF